MLQLSIIVTQENQKKVTFILTWFSGVSLDTIVLGLWQGEAKLLISLHGSQEVEGTDTGRDAVFLIKSFCRNTLRSESLKGSIQP